MKKNYKGYSVEINDRELKINGQFVRPGTKLVLSFGNKSIQEMPKDTPTETLVNMGAEVFEDTN